MIHAIFTSSINSLYLKNPSKDGSQESFKGWIYKCYNRPLYIYKCYNRPLYIYKCYNRPLYIYKCYNRPFYIYKCYNRPLYIYKCYNRPLYIFHSLLHRNVRRVSCKRTLLRKYTLNFSHMEVSITMLVGLVVINYFSSLNF